MFKLATAARLGKRVFSNSLFKSTKKFSSLIPALPRNPIPLEYTEMRNGTVIPKPTGAAIERKPHEIIGYGKDAVIPYTTNCETEYDELYEKARLGYLKIRDNLMQYCDGYWVAVSSAGDALFIGSDQCELMEFVNEFAKPTAKRRVFYVNCVGREILSEIQFEDSVSGETSVDYGKLYEELFPADADTNSVLFDQQILFIGEFAHDNANYELQLMKHDTGSYGVTAPAEAFQGELTSGPTIWMQGIGGRKKARTMSNKYFKVNGLVTKVREVAEHDKFLIGYPIWSRYENVINTTKEEVLTMTPLDGEKDEA